MIWLSTCCVVYPSTREKSAPDFFAASLHLHIFHAFFGGGTMHRNHQFWTTIYHLLVYSSTRLQPKKKCSRFFGLNLFARLLVYPSTLTKSGLKNWKVWKIIYHLLVYLSTCLHPKKKCSWFFSSMTHSEAFSSGTPLKSPVVFLMCCFFKFDRVDFLWVEQDLGWIGPPPF